MQVLKLPVGSEGSLNFSGGAVKQIWSNSAKGAEGVATALAVPLAP